MPHPLDPFTYVLVDRKPVNCSNDDAWFMWFADWDNRLVAQTVVRPALISTVFGGIDRSYGRSPQPLVFETHIFGGEHDGWEEFSSSWEEAELVHAEAVALARGELVKKE
jgi:hypothetical protein